MLIKFVKSLGEFVPAAALLSGLMYVFGIAVASTIDRRLGVGNIEVSRERAISLGLLTLVLSVPYARYALNFEAYKDDLDSGGLKQKLRTLFSIGIHPIVYSIVIAIFFLLAGMNTIAHYIVFSQVAHATFFALQVLLKLRSVSSLSSSTRLVGCMSPFLVMGIVVPFLPVAYGGHQGPEVSIRLHDQPNLTGQVKVIDGRMVVIESNQKFTAIPWEKIESVESVGRVSELSATQ